MADIKYVVFEAIIKDAVIADFKAEMESIPSETEILQEHPLSSGHIRKMKKIFALERRREMTRRIATYAKSAVIVLCVTVTFFFVLLMLNPEVRATVREAIVDFFEGFTRIGFIETDLPTSNSSDFSLQYIPDGFTQTSADQYGESQLIVYENKDGNAIMFDFGTGGSYTVDNEFTVYHTEISDGITYHIYKASDTIHDSNIIWAVDGYTFQINGTAPIEELKRMAYSLTLRK
jgi:hypothetical protein